MKKQNNLQQVLPILLTILIIVLLVIGWKYWSNSNVVEGFESNPIDKIDGVVYINLENREDRKKLIKEEMGKMGIPEDKIHKVSGVFIPKNGHKGCVQSHILALQMAKMNNWDTTLILEDDAELNVTEEEFKNKLSNILDFLKDKEWDVIMIGKANTVEKENHNDIIKLKSGTTSTGYIIKKHYYNKLLDLFIDCNNHMTTDKWGETNKHEPYALDQKWSELQGKDNWYGFKKDLLKQRNIWSTINDKGNNVEGFTNNYQELNMIDFLSKYKNKKIYYKPNSGNGGDALIAEGTYQLMDKLGLNYEILKKDIPLENKIIFYGGGGNLVKMYAFARNFLQKYYKNNTIVILPHTINGNEDLLKDFEDNVKVICREKYSYDHVHKHLKNKNNVYLSKDMAFYLDVSKYNKNINNNNKTLNYFRNDGEKTKISHINKKDNQDLSALINYDSSMLNKELVNKTTYEILDNIYKYDIVNTDRLHGSIAGSLLNKKTTLYTNSYYKNKAVFEYSIKNKFKNTNLIE